MFGDLLLATGWTSTWTCGIGTPGDDGPRARLSLPWLTGAQTRAEARSCTQLLDTRRGSHRAVVRSIITVSPQITSALASGT